MFLPCLLLVASLLVPGLSAQSSPGRGLVDESYSFQDFVREFKKSYATEEEYQKRQKIFQANLRIIREHNRERHITTKPAAGHVLGVNLFADQEPHELPRGYAKMLSSTRQSLTTTDTTAATSHQLPLSDADLLDLDQDVSCLPRSVDWRQKRKTTPVKSQGSCGSCWAFASAAVLETHIAIQTGKLLELSEQELVSCAPNPQHCGGNGGCSGSTAEIAMAWATQKGMVQEWDMGYQSYHGEHVNCTLVDAPSTVDTVVSPRRQLRLGAAAAGGRNSQPEQKQQNHYKGAVVGILGYYKLPTNNYKVLMNTVAKRGPVAVSVACLPWHLYQGGVFYAPLNSTRATDINHLVVLEGYGTDKGTGEDYWLVRNSWSPNWGEDGYIRLLRVDPAKLDDPEQDCGMDTTPADGAACTQDETGHDIIPPPAKICGNSGILYDTVIPVGGYLLS